jgi:hypothetical protein
LSLPVLRPARRSDGWACYLAMMAMPPRLLDLQAGRHVTELEAQVTVVVLATGQGALAPASPPLPGRSESMRDVLPAVQANTRMRTCCSTGSSSPSQRPGRRS